MTGRRNWGRSSKKCTNQDGSSPASSLADASSTTQHSSGQQAGRLADRPGLNSMKQPPMAWQGLTCGQPRALHQRRLPQEERVEARGVHCRLQLHTARQHYSN